MKSAQLEVCKEVVLACEAQVRVYLKMSLEKESVYLVNLSV